jgi:tRNA (Thr-GGU) A37 N-methylase
VAGLDAVSHLWLTFGFSQHDSSKAKDSVRPPRLGGTNRLGVFATRSPYRRNGLGLSLVELLSVDFPTLTIRGADLLDGTPVYDLKPYLPWAESLVEARCEWAPAAPERVQLRWSEAAEAELGALPQPTATRKLVEDCLVIDPRPAYDRNTSSREFRTRIADFDLGFVVSNGILEIRAIRRVGDEA